MDTNIRICMFGGFNLYINNECKNTGILKSKKGMSLLQYIILKHDSAVPNYRLIELLWPNEESSNPENALKTLVSRFRALLNQCQEGLGSCIEASRGGYRFVLLEGMSVDVFEFEEICRKLQGIRELTPENRALYQRALTLYSGDLLSTAEQDEWVVSASVGLHGKYLKLVYEYLDFLKQTEEYNDIIQTCRFALETDSFDERLHLELMNALVKTNRNNEALMQYKHVTNLHFRYLGVKPPEGIQQFYKQIIQAGNSLEMNLDSMREELQEYGDVSGAFECEYAVFREIYNLQMRNLERFGTNMYLAMIMVSSMDGEPIDPLRLDDIMKGLSSILKERLRKGDTFTHFSPSQFALLLPTVTDETSHMVIERIKRFFYQRYPNSNVMFSYRVGPLNPSQPAGDETESAQNRKKKGSAGKPTAHTVK